MAEVIKHWQYKSIIYDEVKQKWVLPKRKRSLKDQCQGLRCNGFRRVKIRKNKPIYLYPYCHKCSKRLDRINHRLRELYNNLRHSAKTRNIPFELTYPEFLVFCNETEYDDRKYTDKASMTVVDRIDPNLGYTFSNIQLLTNGENTAKKNYNNESYHSSDDPF
jgi:hypothetical protein